MDVILANPRGFCAGVDRAIEIVKRAIEPSARRSRAPREWCTTSSWSTACWQRGAVFVEELDEVPDNATVIFSAHGVSPAVRSEAARRGLGVRRDLPAGDEGAPGSRAAMPCRPRHGA